MLNIYIIDDGKVMCKDKNSSKWKLLENKYPRIIMMYNTDHVFLFLDEKGKVWISSDINTCAFKSIDDNRELYCLDIELFAIKACTDNDVIYILDDQGKLWIYDGTLTELNCREYVTNLMWVTDKLVCIGKNDSIIVYASKKNALEKKEPDCTMIDINGDCYSLSSRVIKNTKSHRIVKELIFEEIQTEHFKLIDCICFQQKKYIFITDKNELWFVSWKPEEESDIDDMIYLEKIENRIKCIHILDKEIYFVDFDSELYIFTHSNDFFDDKVLKPNLRFITSCNLTNHCCSCL